MSDDTDADPDTDADADAESRTSILRPGLPMVTADSELQIGVSAVKSPVRTPVAEPKTVTPKAGGAEKISSNAAATDGSCREHAIPTAMFLRCFRYLTDGVATKGRGSCQRRMNGRKCPANS